MAARRVRAGGGDVRLLLRLWWIALGIVYVLWFANWVAARISEALTASGL